MYSAYIRNDRQKLQLGFRSHILIPRQRAKWRGRPSSFTTLSVFHRRLFVRSNLVFLRPPITFIVAHRHKEYFWLWQIYEQILSGVHQKMRGDSSMPQISKRAGNKSNHLLVLKNSSQLKNCISTLERKNFVSESWSRSSRVLVRANWHRKL